MRVIDFAVFMQDKIDENEETKVGWYGLTPKWCLNRARQEMQEVVTAIAKRKKPDEVARECADVANFMMMAADNYREEFEEKAETAREKEPRT